MTQRSSRRAPGDGRYFSAGAGGAGCECVSEHRAETTHLAVPPLPTRRSIKLSRIGGSVFAQLAIGLLSLVKTTGASRVAAIAAATAQKAQAATSASLDDAKEPVDPRRYRGRWQDRATPAQTNVMLKCAEEGAPQDSTSPRFSVTAHPSALHDPSPLCAGLQRRPRVAVAHLQWNRRSTGERMQQLGHVGFSFT